ncbi:Ulp1-like peptidase [Cucumis melo var. makuwa]|uniref:Ulp1-like peptidase n=1 Tax=Cucumis melo var. makuwa TaxID=1194695 RepID=A0A5D3CQ49_CUCMM|nr:Ulp1-like peptidase [Cucumis melo var. makuwa]
MWPIILIPYNLPPWKCMKAPFTFLSLLIPSPRSPGKEIDIYLQPLIDELNELWVDGIQTYDSFNASFFQLRAALLWTINDFPAYDDLSGWRKKGTILNIDGKTKDTIKAREDLANLKIRKELHIQEIGNKRVEPHASYTLTAAEKVDFCTFLKSVKFPDGFAFNISRCVNLKEDKIYGLKSHDCHVLLQRLLPIGIRPYLRGVVCTFGRREFNIITGLWGPKEDYIQLVGNSQLLEKFFKDKECIYVSDLEDIFLEYEGDDDDIVKLALVYFIEISLLGKDRRTKVDIVYIIKTVIEMTPKEEQLKIASDDFKKSKKQKSKIKMKKAIRNLQDRVAVVEGQLNSIKSDIDELKGMMSTILKHIGLQRKGDEGDRKVSEGLVDHTLESKEVDNAKTEDVDTGGTPNWLRMPKEDEHIELKKKGDEDVLEKKVDIGLEEPIDVIDDEDVTKIEPFLTQRPYVRPVRRKRASVYLSTSFTTLPKCIWMHFFLFIHLEIKAAGIPSSHNFTTADTIFMCILVAKWPLYKECIKENRPFDWDEEYRLVNYVVGSKEDFQDPWASVDYLYSPFNVHGNHWVLLYLDLVSCQVKVWDSLPSLTTVEEMTNILLPIRQLVPKLLDSTGFFDRRGRSSTYKEPWPVVIVDSIPLQRNNSDCGVFTIKYFEYIAAGVGLDTLCQENMSYFRKQLAFQLWTNTPMY